MGESNGTVRKRRAAAGLVLLFLVSTACGRREPPPPGSGPVAGSPEAAANPPSVAGTPRGGGEPVRGPKVSAVIVPPSPSRILPPRISVGGSGGQPVPLVDVRWKVEGGVVAEGERLPPAMFRKGDTISAIVTVRTAEGTVSMETPSVTAVRSLPSVTDVRLEPTPIRTGDTVKAVVTAENPDESPLTFRYKWYVDDVQAPGDGSELASNDVGKGAWVHVMVVPNDGISDGAWKYSPKHKVANSPPVVKDDPPTVIQPGGFFLHTIRAVDPDGDALAYALEKAPPGMILNGAVLQWQLPDDAYGKSVQVVVRISDNDGGVTATTFTMTPRKE